MRRILHIQNWLVRSANSLLCRLIHFVSKYYVKEYYTYDELKEEYDRTGKLFDFKDDDILPVYISPFNKKEKRLQRLSVGFLIRLFESINKYQRWR